jgi:transposase
MRGADEQTAALFSYVSCEARVPGDHPLRPIRSIVDEALEVLSAEFDRLYAKDGRPSNAPEKLLRALLLQAFYSIRSERQLMEQLDYNLLFRWFVGLAMDAPVWDPTVFTKNRDRLLDGEVAAKFLAAVLDQTQVKALLSDDHFSVDGTLIEAWASIKSFRAKDSSDDPPGPGRNAERNFHKQKRSNETHQSTTDPQAKLYRKGDGQPAKLCFMGHVLMENRNGLLVGAQLDQASGTAEREEALKLIDAHRPLARGTARRRITLGADKAYDVADFIVALRERQVTPHIAIDGHLSKTGKPRKTAIDARTTHHPGYVISQVIRKRIEESFGWIKTVAVLRKTRHRGIARVGWMFTLAAAAYNLVRIPKLLDAPS